MRTIWSVTYWHNIYDNEHTTKYFALQREADLAKNAVQSFCSDTVDRVDEPEEHIVAAAFDHVDLNDLLAVLNGDWELKLTP